MPLWKRLIFGAVTVVLFFGVVELVCWVAGVSPLLAERDPFRGFSQRMPVYRLDTEAGAYRTLERATLHSFNAQTFAWPKPEGGLRIFVIGGSSAYGFPWTADQAFSRHLQDALRAARPQAPVEVINAAAMSYGSHRLRILVHELLRYEPDVLVVYGGHNEFVERRFYRERLDGSVQLDRLRSVLFRWRTYSLLARLYERAAQSKNDLPDASSATTGELLGLDVAREIPTRIGTSEREEVRTQFEANLRAIVGAAGKTGTRVVLCTVPSNVSGWVPNQSHFGPGVDAGARREAETLLEEARSALAAEDLAKAVTALERARDLAPTHAAIQYYLGRVYELSGRAEQAREAYVRARDHDQQPSRAESGLNDVIRRLGGELDVTLVDLERAFEQATPDGLLGFNLFEDYVHPKPGAHRLIALELWKRFLRDGLAGEPRDAPEEEFWAALESADRSVIATDSTAPSAASAGKTASLLFNLAVVLGNQGRIEEAIEKYRACIELDPGHLMARSNLGRLLVTQGRLAESESEQRSVLAVDPGHLQALLGLGETLRLMNRLEEAQKVFERGVTTDPGSAVGWRALASVRRQRQDWAPAAEAYRRAAELDPTEPAIQAELGVVLLSMQNTEEAEAAFRTCVVLDPEHVAALNGLAAILVQRGQVDQARERFEEVLRIDPQNQYALRSLRALGNRAPQD